MFTGSWKRLCPGMFWVPLIISGWFFWVALLSQDPWMQWQREREGERRKCLQMIDMCELKVGSTLGKMWQVASPRSFLGCHPRRTPDVIADKMPLRRIDGLRQALQQLINQQQSSGAVSASQLP